MFSKRWALPAAMVLLGAMLEGGGVAYSDPAGPKSALPPGATPGIDYVEGELIVKFADDATDAVRVGAAKSVGAREARGFAKGDRRHWRLGDDTTVEEALGTLSKPGVSQSIEYAEPNYIRRAADYTGDPMFGELWGLSNVGQTGGTIDADIDAPEAWGIESGSTGVVVGVIDTGIEMTHEDLAAHIWTNPAEAGGEAGVDDDDNGYVDDVHGWDFVHDDNDPTDDDGHGTHVAGTIGAVGGNGVGVTGVSQSVTLMPLKFLNEDGWGTDANAIKAIEYAASFVDDSGNRVVPITSNSWGGTFQSQALRDAIEESGALFVFAAGNAGNKRKQYPAGEDLANIISVAATDHDDKKARFSSYGSDWVDLGAPGVSILSTTWFNNYSVKSGTSMATPHVSGAAALVLAQDGSRTVAEVKAAILDNVDPIDSLAGKVLTGGRLNAYMALGGSAPQPDTSPPQAVNDLAVASATYDSVTVSWTAPYDDDIDEPVALYDVRYFAAETGHGFSEADWPPAIQIDYEPGPASPGSGETLTITGLTKDTTYHALKSTDEAGNVSGISNGAEGATGTAGAGEWVIETIATDNSFYKNIDFDGDGNPGIAFGKDGGIWVSLWDGSSWQEEEADPRVSTSAGIDFAFAPDGSPSTSYGWGKLEFAYKSGSTWQIDVVENSKAKNDYTSLVYDPDGNPTIAYNRDGSLKYARKVDGTWQTEVIDTAPAKYTSLMYVNDQPVIAYSGGDALKFARWGPDSGSWDIVTADTCSGCGIFATMDYHADADGGLLAATHRGSSTDGVRFTYAEWDGGASLPSSWTTESFDTDEDYRSDMSLAIDADGVPYISYMAWVEEELRVAKRLYDEVGGAWYWDWESVHETDDVTRTYIHIDPLTGKPLVLFRDSGLKLARPR